MQITGLYCLIHSSYYLRFKVSISDIDGFQRYANKWRKNGTVPTFSSAKSMFEQYFKDGVLYSSSILIQQKIYGLLEIDIYPLTNEIRKRMKRVWVWSNIPTKYSKYVLNKLHIINWLHTNYLIISKYCSRIYKCTLKF